MPGALLNIQNIGVYIDCIFFMIKSAASVA